MLRKTLLTLSASMLLGTVVIAPNAALAQLPVLLRWALAVLPLADRLPDLAPVVLLSVVLRSRTPSVGLPVDSKVVPFTVAPLLRLGSLVSMAPGIHGLDHAVQGNLHGLEGRAAAFSNTTRNHVGNSYANHGYGHGGWRHDYWGRYGVYGYGGDSYAQGDGCYYVSAYRRDVYRRVLVCSSN